MMMNLLKLEDLQKVKILNEMYGDLLRNIDPENDGYRPWCIWAHVYDKKDKEFDKIAAYVGESIYDFIIDSNGSLPCIGFKIPVNEHDPSRKTLWMITDICVELADRSLTVNPRIAFEFTVQKVVEKD